MPKKRKARTFRELPALKGLIRERKTAYRALAKEMGIATATFSNKINGYGCFDGVQIDTLCDILEITENQVARYFFPHRCSNYTEIK